VGVVTLRTLARGSLLVTVANLVPRAATFLLLPVYARFLTQAEFGVVSLAGSAALLAAIGCRLGLDQALLRLHYDVPQRDRPDLYVTVAIVAGAAATALAAVGFVAAVLLAGSTDADLAIWLLALGIAAANTFQFIPSVWLRATDRPGGYLALASVAFAAVAAATVLLVVVIRLGASGSLTGQLLGAIVMAVAAGYVLRSMRGGRWRTDLARRSLRFGLPLLPHALSGWVLNLSDRWLLGFLLVGTPTTTLAAVGVYSLGYQLAYAIGLAAISFNAAWLPFLYRVGHGGHAHAVMRDGTTLVVAGFAWLSSALAILAPDVLGIIAPEDWHGAADVTTVAAIGFALQAASLMLASSLYLHRDTAIIPLTTFAAVGVNIAVNLALIPRLGIMGAAWATVAAYGTLALMTGILARRRHGIALDVGRLAAVVAITVGSLLVARAAGEDGFIGGVAFRVLLVAGTAALIALLASDPARALRRVVAADASGNGGEAPSVGPPSGVV
jgi:O-antigen/teichoic acid export membrane protein